MVQSNDLTLTAKVVVANEARITALENGTKNPGGGGTDPSKPTDPSVPDSGVNVDPGKSLTGQKEVWSGSTKQNAEDKLTLDSSVSKNLDNVGDGLQFVFKIIKTPFVTGVQGAASDLVPVASTSTTPVSGQYICSVPVPISIKKGSFAVGTTLTVKLDGIGEGLSGVTVSMAPEVQLTLNNDGTISVKPIEGYAFDKLTSGNTGAYYDVIINSVNTYTVGTPVVPLANGTILWSGSSASEKSVALDSKVNADFSNVGSGLLITTDVNWSYSMPSGMSGGGQNKLKSATYRIAKADLVAGKKVTVAPFQNINNASESWYDFDQGATTTMKTTPSIMVTVASGSLTFETAQDGLLMVKYAKGGEVDYSIISASFTKVETYLE